ncbi:MAG: 30S ribosomal protein S8e [Candidatus Bathyarchaeota archaeon]|nr:MAG: 30S ribosomal protein S8e [Candidatus Bathyarchaeota archaeon]
MAWQEGLRKRKKTGGKKRPYRTKRLRDAGNAPIETEHGDTVRKIESGRSGIEKAKLVKETYVNVSDPSSGRAERLEILSVVENPANVDYNRRGVITKGTIVRTERGLARIVSRPGQDGVLNAVFYEEE